MKTHRRALVVGGGIAGPAVSLFLAGAGIEPVLFEAYPRNDDVGGAFQIAPNGLRVLAALGLADPLLRAGQPSHDMVFRNHRGRTIGRVRTESSGPAVNVSRRTVHGVLRGEVERRGVEIRYEKRLTGVATVGREVVATFKDGSTEVGDFLVGADGVRSAVRACILPEVAAPRDTGMVSLGGFCRPDVAPPADPGAGERVTFVVGPRHQFGYSRMSATSWAWWCHVHPADADERELLLTMPDDALVARMLERYRGWCEPVEQLIEGTEAWLRTRIHDVPTLPTWHVGRALLLGDAAHAMSPAGGQGASLSLEDAMIFAHLAADASTPIEKAMARFESMRRARAEQLVAQGFANDRRSLQELGPVGMWMRDRVMMPLFASFIARALRGVYSTTLPAAA